jgi:ribonuclease BN (tRNA processing enzyme)
MLHAMRVTILGSGTCIPTLDRGPPGVLVQSAGRTILIDLGPGILRCLPATGADIGTVDAVVFTHYHADHCADLAPLLFALKNPLYSGRRPLKIVGPVGLVSLLDALRAAWGSWISPDAFEWTADEVGPGTEVELGGGVSAVGVAVEHTPESLAWRVTDPSGATVAVSGDTCDCPGAVEAGRGADLYVLECAFPDDAPKPWHLTPSAAGRIAAEAEPARLCLTHFYPACDAVDVRSSCRTTWSGPLSLARDGLAFEVRPGTVEEVPS